MFLVWVAKLRPNSLLGSELSELSIQLWPIWGELCFIRTRPDRSHRLWLASSSESLIGRLSCIYLIIRISHQVIIACFCLWRIFGELATKESCKNWLSQFCANKRRVSMREPETKGLLCHLYSFRYDLIKNIWMFFNLYYTHTNICMYTFHWIDCWKIVLHFILHKTRGNNFQQQLDQLRTTLIFMKH